MSRKTNILTFQATNNQLRRFNKILEQNPTLSQSLLLRKALTMLLDEREAQNET